MSLRTDVAAQLQEWAEGMEATAASWSARATSLTPARDAVEEASAILRDAAEEVVKPPRERVRA